MKLIIYAPHAKLNKNMYPVSCYGSIDVALSCNGSETETSLKFYVFKKIERPSKGIILLVVDGLPGICNNNIRELYGIRCVVRESVLAKETINVGDCIEIPAKTTISIAKNGEIILVVNEFKKITSFDIDAMGPIKIVNHPLRYKLDYQHNEIESKSEYNIKESINNTINENGLSNENINSSNIKILADSVSDTNNNKENIIQTNILDDIKNARKEDEQINKLKNNVNIEQKKNSLAEPYSKNNTKITSRKKFNNLVDADIIPVASLNKYMDLWKIRVRCSLKSGVRNYSNSRGSGKLLNVNFIDSSGEIGCTLWQSDVDKYQDIIEVGKVYTISNASIKDSDKRFRTAYHEFELVFNANTVVVLEENDLSIPQQYLDIKPLSYVHEGAINEAFDTVAILYRAYPVTEVLIKRTGTVEHKKNLSFIDMNGTIVDATVWANKCDLFPNEIDNNKIYIVELAKVRIDEYNIRRLKFSYDTIINIFVYNIDLDAFEDNEHGSLLSQDCEKLLNWAISNKEDLYSIKTNSLSLQNDTIVSTIMLVNYINNIDELPQDNSDKTTYFTVSGWINKFHLRANGQFWYDSCSKCNRKAEQITDVNDALWTSNSNFSIFYHCKNCNIEIEKPTKRYSFIVDIEDYAGSIKCQVFDEVGATILGKSAQELYEQLDEHELSQGNTNLDFHLSRFKPHLFRIRIKLEYFQDASSYRFQLQNIEQLQNNLLTKECQRLQSLYKQKQYNSTL